MASLSCCWRAPPLLPARGMLGRWLKTGKVRSSLDKQSQDNSLETGGAHSDYNSHALRYRFFLQTRRDVYQGRRNVEIHNEWLQQVRQGHRPSFCHAQHHSMEGDRVVESSVCTTRICSRISH